ncbi:peptidase U35 [Rhodoplanes elegans]|uniref:Peptidase U35 n=1 Tax=Rhodoplanes elegans TaxID=29408 RepID=A0A327KS42_9BRAD|nr:HK97 family phage prohead protease [Rhodoplanes elegans]MBK5958585.1 peptidase U35 [Rhodoplanes elegans]RAI40523.1 peptidase U35 [Rhodoplanes elegans]
MSRIEFKASLAVDEAGTITGLAWPFGTPDRVGDMVAPGAFKGAAPPVPMLFQHNPAEPVGAWNVIEEKADGLHVTGRLLIEDVARAREVRAFVQSGAVRGLSIGFVTKSATGRKGGGRTITALDLAEISLVTIPMHPGARVTGAKSAAAAIALAEAINRAAAALRTR